MNRIRMLTISALLACGMAGLLSAADAPTTAPATKPAADPATTYKTWADGKADKFIDPLKVADADKLAAAKALVSQYCITMRTWHDEHKAELGDLWKQWTTARGVLPKDDYPGEVVAYKIDALYDSLKPDYEAFIKKLSVPLTEEQVDAFKEAWSKSPGMVRTYTEYVATAPDLTEDQKKVVLGHLQKAREAAMLTDDSKEIINIFKVHKVKAEEYIGDIEWQRLRKVRAAAVKAPAGAPATAPAAE